MTSPASGGIQNPLWDGITDLRQRGLIGEEWGFLVPEPGAGWELNTLFVKYGEVISDPLLVEWVIQVTGPRVVHVDAKLGYWSWLLGQAGKEVLSFDRADYRSWWVIRKMTKELPELTPLTRHTLLIVAPQDMARVARILTKYNGTTAVLILRREVDPNLDTRGRPGSKAAQARRHARATLDRALANEWTLTDRMRGKCIAGELFEAHLYRRGHESPPGWVSETRQMPILARREVRKTGRGGNDDT